MQENTIESKYIYDGKVVRLRLDTVKISESLTTQREIVEHGESVVVVHGLGRSHASMRLLVSRIEDAGYHVINFDYPSTAEPMEELTALLGAEVERSFGAEAGSVHFVTHSMGGVLVRSYLSQQPTPHAGRVVMLSPPSQGSEIIDAFADSQLPRYPSVGRSAIMLEHSNYSPV